MLYTILGSDLSFNLLLAIVLAYIVSVAIAFSVHEFSHAFVAYKMGDNTAKSMGRMTLNPFNHMDTLGLLAFIFIGFGWAKPVQTNPLLYKNYKKGRILVSIAGVLANLILAFIFSGILYFTNPLLSISTNLFIIFLQYFLTYMVVVNLALFVFNLLPIFPLDGFNFITAFMKPINAFIKFMYKYGTIILFLFIITPLFDIVYNFITTNIMNLFFGFWGLF